MKKSELIELIEQVASSSGVSKTDVSRVLSRTISKIAMSSSNYDVVDISDIDITNITNQNFHKL